MNFTVTDITIGHTVQYLPDTPCVEWCTVQKVVNYANIETYTVMIVAFAMLLLLLSEMAHNSEKYKQYSHTFSYFARITLYFFFYVYFFFLKGGF